MDILFIFVVYLCVSVPLWFLNQTFITEVESYILKYSLLSQ